MQPNVTLCSNGEAPIASVVTASDKLIIVGLYPGMVTIWSDITEAGFADAGDKRIVAAYTLGRHVCALEHFVWSRPVAVVTPRGSTAVLMFVVVTCTLVALHCQCSQQRYDRGDVQHCIVHSRSLFNSVGIKKPILYIADGQLKQVFSIR